MSRRAQNRSQDAKNRSTHGTRSDCVILESCGIQRYRHHAKPSGLVDRIQVSVESDSRQRLYIEMDYFVQRQRHVYTVVAAPAAAPTAGPTDAPTDTSTAAPTVMHPRLHQLLSPLLRPPLYRPHQQIHQHQYRSGSSKPIVRTWPAPKRQDHSKLHCLFSTFVFADVTGS
jgi:hypothetical protein